MDQYYRAYGLTLQTSRSVPGLMLVNSPKKVDLRINLEASHAGRFDRLTKQLWYESPIDIFGSYAHVWKLSDGAYYQFSYADGATFVIDRTGASVWASWPKTLSLEEITTYLTGHILGFSLGLKGRFCLHASAIAIDGTAIALMAPGGGGKSTLAAVFAGLGYPVLTDDILAIHQRGKTFFAQPGYPRLNLWPASIGSIPDIGDRLPRIAPDSRTYDKCYLDLIEYNNRFQREPLNLGAIYTGGLIDGVTKPSVKSVTSRDAIIALVPNLYRFPLIDRSDLEKEFDFLGRIASSVPVRSVRFRRDLTEITHLCRVILDDYRSLHPESGRILN